MNNYGSLRNMSRKELEEEIRQAALNDLLEGPAAIRKTVVYESELARRDTNRLTFWMTVAVMCNAVFIAADIVLRWVSR